MVSRTCSACPMCSLFFKFKLLNKFICIHQMLNGFPRGIKTAIPFPLHKIFGFVFLTQTFGYDSLYLILWFITGTCEDRCTLQWHGSSVTLQ